MYHRILGMPNCVPLYIQMHWNLRKSLTPREGFSVKSGHRLSTLRQNIISVRMLGHRMVYQYGSITHDKVHLQWHVTHTHFSQSFPETNSCIFSTLHMFLYISPLRFLHSFNCSLTLTYDFTQTP